MDINPTLRDIGFVEIEDFEKHKICKYYYFVNRKCCFPNDCEVFVPRFGGVSNKYSYMNRSRDNISYKYILR